MYARIDQKTFIFFTINGTGQNDRIKAETCLGYAIIIVEYPISFCVGAVTLVRR